MAKHSLGTTLIIGSDTVVGGLTAIPAPPKTADTLDSTTLSTEGGYRTFIGSWKDGGEVQVSGYFDPTDLGQNALETAFEAGTEEDFQIVYPAELNTSHQFKGVVTGYTAGDSELESLLAFQATIKVSGKPERTTSVSAGLSGLSLTGTGGTLAPTFSGTKYYYTFDSVTATSVTVTPTAADHEIKLYINGVYSETIASGGTSASIALTVATPKKLTIVTREAGKVPVVYEVIVLKVS